MTSLQKTNVNKPSSPGDYVILLPDFDFESVAAVQQLIYTGECSVSANNVDETKQLLGIISDR